MIDAAPAHSPARRSHAPLWLLVILGVMLSRIPLWFLHPSTRLIPLWLTAIGLSAVCAWLVPHPRRWLVGLGSLMTFLGVLFVDAQWVQRWRESDGWWWSVVAPLVSLALIHLYLRLCAWAVPLTDRSISAHADAPSSAGAALWRRRVVALLIVLHALGVGLYWAYVYRPCTWLDLTRRVQGCTVAQPLPSLSSETYKIQLTPSGTLAASAIALEETPTPSVWNAESFEALQQRLAAQASTISLWNLQTGTLLRTLEQPTRAIDITFAPNDQWVATRNYDRQVRIWKVADGTLQYTLPDASLVVFSPDGSLLATANGDSQVQLRSLRDGTVARTITLGDNSNLLDQMVFSPDGTLLAVRDLDEVTLWRVRDGGLHQSIETDQFGTFLGTMLSFSPDGQTLATTGRSFDTGEGVTTVRLWRVRDGTLLHTLNVNEVLGEQRHRTDMPMIAFSPDSTRLLAVANQWPYPDALLIWRVADGVLLEHSKAVTESDLIRFSADATAVQIYTTRYDTVRIYTQPLTDSSVK